MAIGRTTPLDRLLGRLEDLDATNLTILVQRLARERKLLETVINTVREGILVINQFTSLPKRNVIFIIGMDTKMVADALEYSEQFNANTAPALRAEDAAPRGGSATALSL